MTLFENIPWHYSHDPSQTPKWPGPVKVLHQSYLICVLSPVIPWPCSTFLTSFPTLPRPEMYSDTQVLAMDKPKIGFFLFPIFLGIN